MTLNMVMTFFRYNTKTQSKKEIMDNLESIKIKNFCFTKYIVKKKKKKTEEKPQAGRKYLQKHIW